MTKLYVCVPQFDGLALWQLTTHVSHKSMNDFPAALALVF